MFCSLLAMSMFMTLAASQDTPGLNVTAVVDLKNVVDLETKALVVPPLEIKDAAKSYPALMDGENAGVKAGLRGTEPSSGVLLKAVRCVKPSTGVDGWVNDMVGGLAAVAIATAGAGACVGTAGAACAVIAAGAGASMGVITQTAVDNGVLASIGSVFPGSDDDLYITMDGTKVWPSYSDHGIGSQETVYPNIFRNGRPTICLMERDSGWWSSDDNMGCADTHSLKPGHVSLIIVSKEEGSSYIVELQISAPKPIVSGKVYEIRNMYTGNHIPKTKNQSYLRETAKAYGSSGKKFYTSVGPEGHASGVSLWKITAHGDDTFTIMGMYTGNRKTQSYLRETVQKYGSSGNKFYTSVGPEDNASGVSLWKITAHGDDTFTIMGMYTGNRKTQSYLRETAQKYGSSGNKFYTSVGPESNGDGCSLWSIKPYPN